MSVEVLIDGFSKLFDKHSQTVVQVLSLILLGILLWGFTLIADNDESTRWMYFILACSTVIVIFIVLYFIKKR